MLQPYAPIFCQTSRTLDILISFVRDPVGMLPEATASEALLLDWWSKMSCKASHSPYDISYLLQSLPFFSKSKGINSKIFILPLRQTFLHHCVWMDSPLEQCFQWPQQKVLLRPLLFKRYVIIFCSRVLRAVTTTAVAVYCNCGLQGMLADIKQHAEGMFRVILSENAAKSFLLECYRSMKIHLFLLFFAIPL